MQEAMSSLGLTPETLSTLAGAPSTAAPTDSASVVSVSTVAPGHSASVVGAVKPIKAASGFMIIENLANCHVRKWLKGICAQIILNPMDDILSIFAHSAHGRQHLYWDFFRSQCSHGSVTFLHHHVPVPQELQTKLQDLWLLK